jgi:hypothetical protein
VAKGKKKSKTHQSLHKAIKPFVKDSRVLYTVLGALGAGVALGAALGSEKGGSLVDRITAAVKHLAQHNEIAEEKLAEEKEEKPKLAKRTKKTKPFAAES